MVRHVRVSRPLHGTNDNIKVVDHIGSQCASLKLLILTYYTLSIKGTVSLCYTKP